MHFRSPSPVSIPWNPSGKELPTFCTVNDLEDTDVGVQALTVSGMFLLSLFSKMNKKIQLVVHIHKIGLAQY